MALSTSGEILLNDYDMTKKNRNENWILGTIPTEQKHVDLQPECINA